MNDIGNLIKHARIERSTIIRRGTCEPKTAGKLAAGLGVPVAEIIEERS